MPEEREEVTKTLDSRKRIIIRTSLIGIGANIALAAMKAAVGLAADSIAVLLDAVNNLSDALSSVVTIIGARIAGRAPDRKHPLGHGRMEYVSAMIVAAIVLYAGVSSLIESVKSILSPSEPEYTAVSLAVLAAAVLVKIVLGTFVKRRGRRVKSDALIASGADAVYDALISLSVLVCALIYLMTGLSLEAYVALLISAFIIRSGVGMVLGTVDDLLGKRADPEISARVRELLEEEPEVRGAYDLFFTNYGPERDIVTAHLELPDTLTADDIDVLTRRLQQKVFEETGVILACVGVYAWHGAGEESALREQVKRVVTANPWVLGMHGFRVDPKEKTMRLDVVLSFDIGREEALRTLTRQILEICPGYTLYIVPDTDLSD